MPEIKIDHYMVARIMDRIGKEVIMSLLTLDLKGSDEIQKLHAYVDFLSNLSKTLPSV